MPALLAIIPHPDDESYSFGGTIALAARAGWRCYIECATHGERGKRHDGGPTGRDAIAEVREAELEASCRVLWAEPPGFWGLPDGDLRLHRGEQSRIQRLFRDLQPDLVLTLGPDGAYGHPDHTALHRWVREAWGAMPEPRPNLLFAAFQAGLFLPQYEKCIGMMGDPPSPAPEAIGSDTFDYELDISTVANVKRKAIAAHRSQLPGGDPEAMFPPGIVAALMEAERFAGAAGSPQPATAALLASIRPKTAGTNGGGAALGGL